MSTLPPPYTSLKQVEDLAAAGSTQELKSLHDRYMDYFRQNECEPIGAQGWNDLGAYFLKLARHGSHGMKQTRAQFEAATAGMLRQPVPAWIHTIEYVQTDLGGPYYLALPPKVLAEQAFIHAHNPVTDASSYVKPPVYTAIDPTLDPQTILNSRICDYVISHCA